MNFEEQFPSFCDWQKKVVESEESAHLNAYVWIAAMKDAMTITCLDKAKVRELIETAELADGDKEYLLTRLKLSSD